MYFIEATFSSDSKYVISGFFMEKFLNLNNILYFLIGSEDNFLYIWNIQGKN